MKPVQYFYYTAVEAYVNEAVTESRIKALFGLPVVVARDLIKAYHATSEHLEHCSQSTLKQYLEGDKTMLDVRVEHWWGQVKEIIEPLQEA